MTRPRRQSRGRAALDPESTRAAVVEAERRRDKPFLRAIHAEWRAMIESHLPRAAGPIVEMGAGARVPESEGTGSRFGPRYLHSDVRILPGIDVVLSGERLGIRDSSVGALVMTDVFHHLPDAHAALGEVDRTLEPGGRLIMIEPWLTSFSRWIYTWLHHEPMDPRAAWTTGSRPMMDANLALPWIVFERDIDLFVREFPRLKLLTLEPIMPLAYLLSGGVRIR